MGAYKAVIRGQLIQMASRLKQEKWANILKLENEFKSFSKAHKTIPMPESLSKLDTAKLALNLALTTDADKKLKMASGTFLPQKG